MSKLKKKKKNKQYRGRNSIKMRKADKNNIFV